MTAFGTTSTRNLLSEEDMSGYEGVHTLRSLGPCCTDALDGLDDLTTSESVEYDVFSALVVAVHEFDCRDEERGQRREILLLCDAQRYADHDALNEETNHLLEGIDSLRIQLFVVSTSPLPESGVLRTLHTSLGERFEFARLECAGLREQQSRVGIKLGEGGREVKREAEPLVEPKSEVESEAELEEARHEQLPDQDSHADKVEERRVDPTDPGGGAFTRAEFVEFYGGTDEWDAAFDKPTVDLARRALRAHLTWIQLDKDKKRLRSLAKSTADKCVREAMAAQFAAITPTNAANGEAALADHGGGDGSSSDCGGGGGGNDSDAFADWDLRPAANAVGPDLVPKGAAFMVTGALVPADHAKARVGAAVAHAAAAAQTAEAAARVDDVRVREADMKQTKSGVARPTESDVARVGADEAAAAEVAAEEAEAEAEAAPPEVLVAANAAEVATAAAEVMEAIGTTAAHFGEAGEFTLSDATVDAPQSARHLNVEEAAALAAESLPPTRLALAPPDDGAAHGIYANDGTVLCRLLDHGLPFARILLLLPPQDATLLATGTCRAIRQQSAPLYNRYCRVFVRRLEAEARHGQHETGSSSLTPPDAVNRAHFPADEPDGDGGRWPEAPADGVASEVWAEVGALVDEAACHAYLRADASCEMDAPWRLRVAVATLREVASVGAFQVQTLAPDPTKLKVLKEGFEMLEPDDKEMLLERGVVVRTETVVSAANARVVFSHAKAPTPRPLKSDVDLATQLAACSQQWKMAEAELEQLKEGVRSSFSANAKVVVFGEGAVKLCKSAVRPWTRVAYGCPGGMAKFHELSDEEQVRVRSAFCRPDALLHVRGEAVGAEQGGPRKRHMSVNSSGRALAVGFSVAGEAARLPSHAFASRSRQY